MAIHLLGEGSGRMASAFLDDTGMGPSFNKASGVAMP